MNGPRPSCSILEAETLIEFFFKRSTFTAAVNELLSADWRPAQTVDGGAWAMIGNGPVRKLSGAGRAY